MEGDRDAFTVVTESIHPGSVWWMPGLGILASETGVHRDKLRPHLVVRPCLGGYLCIPRTTKEPRKPRYKIYFTEQHVCPGLDKPGWFLLNCAFPFALRFFHGHKLCTLPNQIYEDFLKAYENFIDKQKPRIWVAFWLTFLTDPRVGAVSVAVTT